MSDILVLAHFNDGYTFRNTIAIIKQICPSANLSFTKTGISIIKSNKSEDILVMMEIKTSELAQYEMNVFDDNDNPVEQFDVGIDMGELLKITKNIGKKDGMIMYCKSGDNKLYINIVGNNTRISSGQSFYFMTTFFMERESFSKIEHSRDESNPNAKPSAAEFAKMCTGMTTIKCSYVIATGYPKGITFTGMLPGKIAVQHTKWGICSTSSDGDSNSGGSGGGPKIDQNQVLSNFIFDTGTPSVESTSDVKSQLIIKPFGDIPIKTDVPKLKIEKNDDSNRIQIRLGVIKALSKLNNLSISPIKLYMDKKMPLKIVSKIGSYGQLTVLAKNAVI